MRLIDSLRRRGALGAMIGLGAAAAMPAARAQMAAPGEKIWHGMDSKALDAAFDQSVWAPNFLQIVNRFIANSDAMHARLGPPRTIAYGTGAAERLHIYTTAPAGAPIFVFLHGGAWRSATAENYAFAAEMFMAAGAVFVGVDFDWVQDVHGDLTVLVAQIRRAFACVHARAGDFGGDRTRIYVGGHSSGAHLAAVMLATDWGGLGLPQDLIKGGAFLSGIYDLAPVRLSSRAAYIDFTDTVVEELSPIRHVARVHAPAILAFGSYDSPEFQRQSRAFAAALQQAGKRVQLVEGAGYNHFELMETAANPFGVVGLAILAHMNLRLATLTCHPAKPFPHIPHPN